jgi:hypothetical protein
MRTVNAGRSQNRFGRWKFHHHCTGREYRPGRKRRREESATREENAVGDQISVGKKVFSPSEVHTYYAALQIIRL